MRCTFACRSEHRSTVLYVGTRTVPDAVRLRCCTCQVRATKTTQASPAAGRSTQGCGTCKLQLNRPAQWRFQPSGILVRAETLISCCTLCTTSIVRPSIYLNHQIKAPLYLLGYFFSSIGLSAEGENSEPKCSRTKRLVHLGSYGGSV
jgi:hypothetical protein